MAHIYNGQLVSAITFELSMESANHGPKLLGCF